MNGYLAFPVMRATMFRGVYLNVIEDGQVLTRDVLGTYPPGTVKLCVHDKADSGPIAPEYSVAVGEGVNGNDCLRVHTLGGIFDLWFIRMKCLRKDYAEALNSSLDMFLAPADGRPYNRFEVKLRYPPGYFKTYAAKQPPAYPNSTNFHVGTYHARDDSRHHEQANYHFYFQIWIRHDLADGDWITLRVNEVPQHQRSMQASLPANPSVYTGGFWDSETRLYLTGVPYNRDQEVENPEVLVDGLRVFWEDPKHDVTVEFVGVETPESERLICDGTAHSYRCRIINHSDATIPGRVYQQSHWILQGKLRDVLGNEVSRIVLAPREVRDLVLELKPAAIRQGGSVPPVGVSFIADDQFTGENDKTVSMPNHSDPRIEKRWQEWLGPHDAEVHSAVVQFTLPRAIIRNRLRPAMSQTRATLTLQETSPPDPPPKPPPKPPEILCNLQMTALASQVLTTVAVADPPAIRSRTVLESPNPITGTVLAIREAPMPTKMRIRISGDLMIEIVD